MSLPFISQYRVCRGTKDLLQSQGCDAAFYTGTNGLIGAHIQSRDDCKKVKKGLALVNSEEEALGMNPGLGDVSEDSIGDFWGILETRPYVGLAPSNSSDPNFPRVVCSYRYQ